MKSAGNDIVVLKAIDKQRSCLPRFYSKFITPAELNLYSQTEFSGIPLEKFVWLLWSVKESAFKYLQRNNTDLVFSPSKITINSIDLFAPELIVNFESDGWECSDEVFYKGTVGYKDHQIHFQSQSNNYFIATIVNDDENFSDVYWGVKFINEANSTNQSSAVRSFALKKLKTLLAHDELRIEKSPSVYPVLLLGEKELNIRLSFSHHDHYVAYSFLLSADQF